MTMLKIPGMLLIGSAGANAGKTHFACALIEKFRKVHKVIAIKVTTITEKDGNCPRGGKGCGVCASECPAKAIELNWYEDDQMLSKIDALLEEAI